MDACRASVAARNAASAARRLRRSAMSASIRSRCAVIVRRGFRAAGAEHLAVHFGDPDGYVRRMAAFARAARKTRG
ncbi:hypothetical protein SO3561_07454 [Streptomyces olivochromogenes]|uniref:Uncharacterized protein n=1 Tax=Streptomyces olivochromogenes TaxID=1963 RepID=A0A250VP20_STROL|nr:hypothetical protein SO3561_07454 [Streptomyces olivochromogenes]